MRRSISYAALVLGALTCAAPAFGQEPASTDDTFSLGQIVVTARTRDGFAIGGSTIGQEDLRAFNKQSVDQALDLIPGVAPSNTGGSRNERLIFVRGFDRFQTTLSIDGVRVFLPADNRIDFGRFLTADLAEIQVSKGYVSVLDGPGGLGGAINLVTRKPTQPFEAEAVVSATADGDGSYNGYNVSALVGGRTDKWYWQASGAKSDKTHWALSDHFTPTALENGGYRDHSEADDYRVNLKAGFTPNATDEYALSVIRQEGSKNAPYHVTDAASTRFWTWPYWNIDSIYFLSKTQLGDRLTVKSRIYYNSFENLLSSFDNAAQNTQTLPRAFNSYYDDSAWGGSLMADFKVTDTNTLRGSGTFRRDEHNERQDGFTRVPATGNPSTNRLYNEPWQPTEEDTYSVALEDTQALSDKLDVVAGASYEWTDLREATDVNVIVTGSTIANSTINYTPVAYPLKDHNALNGQAAVTYRFNDKEKIYASVSSRTRFPTLFERFSSRMGTAVPNPDIEPERALNLEVGGSVLPAHWLKLDGAIFRRRVRHSQPDAHRGEGRVLRRRTFLSRNAVGQ
ncbi:MAG: TonB-dependent receptor [Alphaproteobacteria bacterium]